MTEPSGVERRRRSRWMLALTISCAISTLGAAAALAGVIAVDGWGVFLGSGALSRLIGWSTATALSWRIWRRP